MESMYFTFDGEKSSDYGLYIMRIGETGFMQNPMWGGLNVHQSEKRIVPYFYGVTRENLELPPLQLVLCDENMQPRIWDSTERYKIAKWLCHDTYKELILSSDLGRRYYVIAEAQTDLHLINNQGYMEVQFICNSPYAFSPVYISQFDLSDNTSGTTTIVLENKSNVLKYYNPIIEIQLTNGATGVTLTNQSNGGKKMILEGLTANSTISIDCENRIMKSSVFNENPFEGFNKDYKDFKRYWMDLVFGENIIQVENSCIITTKMQYPIAQ